MIQLPLKVNGLQVKVTPVSPLAKAQNLDEVNEVMQFFQIANALGPGGVAEVKPDAIAAYVGDKLGIPSELRTSPEEKQQIQKQTMEMLKGQSMQIMRGAPQAPEQKPEQQEPVEAVEEHLRS